ncbi:MAG: LarC family nickel insertion protein [Firmicutes bacterium]|nr:LarC family nickel insertion protein [Bacillota bacterium]
MNTLYINCGSGASGDMMLAAFIDLGMPVGVLTDELAGLGLNEFDLHAQKRVISKDLTASDVEVILHDPEAAWVHPYSGKYRNYEEIKSIIDHSKITSTAKDLSRRIFDVKATAEASVHGVSADQVQFHEAGAVDSIVDIVGTAICLDYFHVERVISTPVPTGFGTVLCACGELPVPPPAVKAILDTYKLPHYRSDVEQELLTPTGASILAAMVDEFADPLEVPGGCRTGYGVGKRHTGLPPLALSLDNAE